MKTNHVTSQSEKADLDIIATEYYRDEVQTKFKSRAKVNINS